MLLSSSLAVSACMAATAATQQQQKVVANGRPNIVFILTDDQDLHMNSLDYMPLLKKYITDEGTSYQKHYCTTAICCPSRVSLLTGMNAHNTNVTNVGPPYGGYPKFISQGFNDKYLPIWLQEAGYNTFYTGKLFNAHTVDNYDKPHAAGWTTSDFFLDPYTYSYLKVRTQRNKDTPVDWSGNYSTDVLATKAYGLLDDAIKLKDPFFLMIAPTAPHADIGSYPPVNGELMMQPIPAQRHKHLFPGVKVPRTKNFNPDQPSGASWIKKLEQLNSTKVDHIDGFYRARLQALQAVDEIIEGVIERLSAAGILEDTYVVYSTDNGYHIGQHRLPPGKECHYETDVHIPLIIRGPGIPVGETTDAVTAHVDLAPTFLEIAGASPRPDFDGSAIPLDRQSLQGAKIDRQEHVNVEFWGLAIGEGQYPYSLEDGQDGFYMRNNTYKTVRVISSNYSISYTVWCTNEHELYDMLNDPDQLLNLYPSASARHQTATPNLTTLPAPIPRLLPRLDALLMITKSCKGETCRRPWNVLHPRGDVKSLGDALSGEFDAFYQMVGETIKFDRCELGYILSAEGPQTSLVYGETKPM